MKYKEACGDRISMLAFGTMRLPQEDGAIDQEQVNAMTDFAIKNGVNYFDTAYPYHDGRSELAIGEALSKHPRDSFFLADKFPGHQFMKEFADMLDNAPSWAELCKQRDEAAAKLRSEG